MLSAGIAFFYRIWYTIEKIPHSAFRERNCGTLLDYYAKVLYDSTVFCNLAPSGGNTMSQTETYRTAGEAERGLGELYRRYGYRHY